MMQHQHWKRWPAIWQHVADAVRARGGTATGPDLAPPATDVPAGLPESLRNVLTGLSARVSFSWELGAERPPPPIDGVFRGGFTLDLADPTAGLTFDASGRVLRGKLVLGDSFMDYLDRWTLVGCATDITPFRTRTADLDPFSDEAILWRRWLGLKVLS